MKLRKLWPLLLLIIALIVLYLLGPQYEVDDRLWKLDLPDDLDDYLARSEARFYNITPGAEKQIVWAGDKGVRTDYAVVFLHGFSATRQELAPLPERVARALGANLFATRFAGHGQDGEDLANATVNYWLNDGQEALAIGRRLGERVVIISNSTGSTVATWLAAQPWARDVWAFVMISPNYGVSAPGTELLTLPWGAQLADCLLGPTREWEPANEEQRTYWTTRYPTRAILPVAAMVKLMRQANLERIDRPVLTLYCPEDTVINPNKVRPTVARFASRVNEVVSVPAGGKGDNHILAGDICWPENTEPMTDTILEFLRSLE